MYIPAVIARFLLFMFRPRPRYRPHQMAKVRMRRPYTHLPDRVLKIEARRWSYRYGHWVYDGTEFHVVDQGIPVIEYATTSRGVPEGDLYDLKTLDYARPFPILRDSLVTS